MAQHIVETSVNFISEGTRVEGKISFGEISRVHGILIGDVQARDGSTLILGETSVVEGNIHADTLVVDGYVRGDIEARTKVVISRTGRVFGNVQAPVFAVEFGAYFEGNCKMENLAAPATA
ncbi:MAG: hypothetical protein A2X94_05145 [Bdellovibrionales bacterium GWB1_55_8]|nr:MAG: hypothetical protein A2X94_05145 [Bdellovibrionales bacterium GWB1_55_8]